ncbi:hypothetical protein KM043_018369 [Ampulex compressa]|nr:hypothetical protein KM043_018369 [Ampulex compressa]
MNGDRGSWTENQTIVQSSLFALAIDFLHRRLLQEVLYPLLLTLALSAAVDVRYAPAISSSISADPRRTLDSVHSFANNQKLRQPKAVNPVALTALSSQDVSSKISPHYRAVKPAVQKNPYTGQSYMPEAQKDSYRKQPVLQTEPYQSNQFTVPYFDSILGFPNTYKLAADSNKPAAQISAQAAPLQAQFLPTIGSYAPSATIFNQDKAISLPTFTDFMYPLYPGATQPQAVQSEASTTNSRLPVYKSAYPVAKSSEYSQVYAPNYQSTDAVSSAGNEKLPSATTVSVNGRKMSLPLLQLQSTEEYPGYLHGFDNQPVVLNSGLNYQADPGLSFGFESASPKPNIVEQPSNVSPFLSPLSSFQSQIVPIQAPGGAQQFPRYKGASVDIYSAGNLAKLPSSYESIQAQPQLHFATPNAPNSGPSVGPRQTPARQFTPAEEIRADVETFNKKKPPPPRQHRDDEDEEEPEPKYKTNEKEYSQSSAEDENSERSPGKIFKDSNSEGDFKPSKSFPFKQYDEKFGKYSKQADDEESGGKSFSKQRNYPSAEEDDEEDGRASSKYRSGYSSPKSTYGKYEDEDEDDEESQKYEKRQDAEEDSDYEVQPKSYYGKDLEQEYEESYRKELPKSKYVHVKEVPDVDHEVPRSSKKHKESSRSRANEDDSEETKGQSSRGSYNYQRAPKSSYRDTDAYSSEPFSKTAPKVVYEETFGYKSPEKGKYSRHAKDKKGAEKYSTHQKTKEDGYSRVTKSPSRQINTKAGDSYSYRNGDSYSYPSERKLKFYSNSPDTNAFSGSFGKDFAALDERGSSVGTSKHGETYSPLKSEFQRDLRGI